MQFVQRLPKNHFHQDCGVDHGWLRLKSPSVKYKSLMKFPWAQSESHEMSHHTSAHIGLSRECRDWTTGREDSDIKWQIKCSNKKDLTVNTVGSITWPVE